MTVNANCITTRRSMPPMSKTADKERGERLQAARKLAGFETASAAAESLGVPEPTYLAHENGSRGITASVGEQYARRFKVDYSWLMTNKGTPPAELRRGFSEPSAPMTRTTTRRITLAPDVLVAMRPIEVIGAVQAGVWLATVELPKVDRFEIPLPIQAGFDNFDVFGLIVRGASMDEIYPHGSILAVVKFLDLGRDPRNGERVVALRFRHGESEATVKEFRVGKDGKARLWPRSTHPDFQSPVLVDQPSDEAEEVQIAYLVIGSYRPEM